MLDGGLDGQIDDSSFVSGLQWLISNNVMTIPPTEQGTGSDDVIPGWIKNNAGWWADGQIDDGSFVSGTTVANIKRNHEDFVTSFCNNSSILLLS